MPPVDLFNGALCGDAVFKGQTLAFATGVAAWCAGFEHGQCGDNQYGVQGNDVRVVELAMVRRAMAEHRQTS